MLNINGITTYLKKIASNTLEVDQIILAQIYSEEQKQH